MSDSTDYTSLFRLDGRKVVVVGGGSGLGRAASIALAQYGANLVVADVNVEGLKDTIAEIEAQGYSAESTEIDVTDTESVVALAAAHPDTEVLVATPGINVRKQVLNTTDDESTGSSTSASKARTGSPRRSDRDLSPAVRAASSTSPASARWSSSRVRGCTPPPKVGCCN